ncbi:methylated-DNA--[protein]-cysteine S-methyltransferase [Carnobacterium sp. PL24RED07]|uniref:methylated-DNA--[protein]-cysteine S-methyltransferase n=1 Tax=unclassified Carnobacterium TaxID=257487 RepID=UPI0011ECCDFD|nr:MULTISPECIES: methylated-DNA--[protein]-cysteine S-methyltransferase [unclassified Carnobacterium]KAF3299967.1 methylated-DNA--[protein]-cysteine S-methyltransferase [Carnobacterium sp. PL26RED25]KAF3304673.1 methylated-DNA--[protein]-cysteine S-methyltransferase [Carnobacterium sp. PL24RED07]
MLYKYPYQSEVGIITLLANDHGLLGAWFENQSKFGGTFDLDKIEPISEFKQSVIINEVVKWLDAYFKKQPFKTVDFRLMPQGTAFQQDVWSELQKIPYGETITLDELVERIKARQTKGQGTVNAIIGAINSNPITIMIPSHRILISSNLLATNHLGHVLREFESS